MVVSHLSCCAKDAHRRRWGSLGDVAFEALGLWWSCRLDQDGQRCLLKRGELAGRAACLVEAREIRLHRFPIAQNGKRFAQNLCRSGVRRHDDFVVYPFAFAARGDYTRAAKIGQMPRNFGLALAENLNEITDTHLASVHEIEQAQARLIGKSGKQQGEVVAFRGTFHIFMIYGLTDMSSGEYIRFSVCKETAHGIDQR